MESSFQTAGKTKVEFLKRLPGRERLYESLGFKPEKFLVIHDKKLAKAEGVGKWLAEFALTYPVTAGEELKDLWDFPKHIRRITRLLGPFSSRSVAIIGVGGGTVGDFTGFVASVLKRGVPLVQVPTTVLAAMDSAHGGKTAMNLDGVKNQIGTFYPAEAVMIAKSVFDGLPDQQLRSAAGELVKMGLIAGGELFERCRDFTPGFDFLWDCLPGAIAAKCEVVERDPFERSGERQILNLGHTLGHALESHYGLPHGLAVGQGLVFAVLWSEHKGYLRGSGEMLELLAKSGFLAPREFARKHRPMSRSRLERYLSEDKKMTDSRHLTFVFLEGAGRAFRKSVTLDSFLTETQRQGWTSV